MIVRRMRSTPNANCRIIRTAVQLTLVATILLWLATSAYNDGGPMGMLLGFAPRWWSALPWLVLVPAAVRAGPGTISLAVVGAAVSVFGVAQFELPSRLASVASGRVARGDIRVVTYNTDISASLADRLRSDVQKWNADVILLQDCKTMVADSMRAIFGVVAVMDRFCVASRWPMLSLDDAASLPSPRDLRLARGGLAVRVRVKTPFGTLPVYSVHLPSPREALAAARWPDPANLLPRLRASLAERGAASAAVSRIVSRTDNHFIVAGDFNLPYGSVILQRDWGDLTNAFAHAGFGFGHTMQAGIFPVRIDHVLVPETLEPINARVLRGYPSEHQPVVVDLAWRG
jgi:endonuclease/exonuclease/phosphatase (EEP) superfamily protein YafD